MQRLYLGYVDGEIAKPDRHSPDSLFLVIERLKDGAFLPEQVPLHKPRDPCLGLITNESARRDREDLNVSSLGINPLT